MYKETKSSKAVKWFLIGISVLFVVLMLLLPLITVITEAFKQGFAVYQKAVTDNYTVKAIWLTLEATALAVVINTVFGLSAAWSLTKFHFRGKKILTTLIDLPVTVSPIIAGLIFLLTFGRQSPIFPLLQEWDVKIVFAVPGIVLATIFVTFPFISLYGVVLCAARAMGEFGAVSVISGHLRGKTNTLPLHVEILFNEFQYVPAFAVASILVLLAIFILIARSLIEYNGKKKNKVEP